ncbi:MAG: hypothetical protein JWO40_817 [Candidatus Doudnabacteria bacterium]|nr:hypothetical protein [Candidatus Doudnabacteria bacterium]
MSKEKYSSQLKQKGFTLIELMMSIFIFSMLCIGLFTLYNSFFTNYKTTSKSLDKDDQARKVTFTFITELRNATWGNDGSYPVNQATNTQFIFYSTSSTNSAIINRVRYYISNNVLYKGVITPTGSPLSYNPSNEVITTVENALSNNNDPVFLYYDDNYSGTTAALSQPVNLTTVKFVKINLELTNTGGVTNTQKYTIDAGAAIRNLKTNLGN